ncbi:MAG: pyridoxamine 5'-phosphate oxidase family protein [Chromatiales bacterium]|nr:pyridoxamine 5'-phosphate oxidase family protein [Chromatiales bacterium]
MSKKLTGAACVAALGVFALVPLVGNLAQAQGSAPREIAQDGRIVLGPPITPQTVKSPDHPRYPRGWTCAECHDISFEVDMMSTASRMYLRNFAELPQDEIWDRIVEFLPGRERFVMATVFEGRPTATTVDMVLDVDEKMLYVVSEHGTEKLMHLEVNPRMSAVRAAGWTVAAGGARQWVSVQINGTVELIDATDERFFPTLERYQLARIDAERAARRFVIQRIKPEDIFYFNTNLEQEGYSVYQLWKRDGKSD